MPTKLDELAGINIHKPCIQVKHASLLRAGTDSIFRSNCPECKEGMLLVRRDQNTLELDRFDRCILCGQKFEYTDIEKLRAGKK